MEEILRDVLKNEKIKSNLERMIKSGELPLELIERAFDKIDKYLTPPAEETSKEWSIAAYVASCLAVIEEDSKKRPHFILDTFVEAYRNASLECGAKEKELEKRLNEAFEKYQKEN